MEEMLKEQPATTMALLYHVIHSDLGTSSGYVSPIPYICITIDILNSSLIMVLASGIIIYTVSQKSHAVFL